MIKIYGIKNCSTVKKALNWLQDNDLEFEFHDYKKLGIDQDRLQAWCQKWGWETVLNRKGMMWRKADEKIKNQVVDQESAIKFMIDKPNSIKRPIIEADGESKLIGFNEGEYTDKL